MTSMNVSSGALMVFAQHTHHSWFPIAENLVALVQSNLIVSTLKKLYWRIPTS